MHYMNSREGIAVFVVMIVLVALGIGVGWGIGTTVPAPAPATVTTSSSSSSSASSSASSSTFDLTLVITTANIYNSTIGEQPAFYILGPKGLQSAANITLPAHQLIKLTIVCYDDGAANIMGPQYATVSGTQNNSETVVNNDNVNSSQAASGIQVNGGQTVSIVNASDVAHTFTIPQLGINVPIVPSSTVTVYFTISQTGTFFWFCETDCGSGPKGTEGAMSTPGWMTGAVNVS
jgi:heme/copper-type cytochrome/quinol oxidase subunit 2